MPLPSGRAAQATFEPGFDERLAIEWLGPALELVQGLLQRSWLPARLPAFAACQVAQGCLQGTLAKALQVAGVESENLLHIALGLLVHLQRARGLQGHEPADWALVGMDDVQRLLPLAVVAMRGGAALIAAVAGKSQVFPVEPVLVALRLHVLDVAGVIVRDAHIAVAAEAVLIGV